MNLLTSPWIPIRERGTVRQIMLEELLCRENDVQLSLYRDDMETAALQLLVALTQAILTPNTDEELRNRVAQPLTPEAFSEAATPLVDWFELDHKQFPFMQSRGVSAKEPTPIQKLFVGLPEGNNHAFFNTPGEIRAVCPSCAAIALFNQASNCPSFGGGFKANLRGGNAPVNIFVTGDTLRQSVWLNVLTANSVARILPNENTENRPNWVHPIKAGEKVGTHTIGLLRGLFWQPARVALRGKPGSGLCDSCQQPADFLYTGFDKEKFVYDVAGLWPHPHSPQIWDLKKDGSKEKLRFLSFTTEAPAWTQLNQYLFSGNQSIPAQVVQQFKEIFPRQGSVLNLYVSGYRNKKASILMRRHELFSIPQAGDLDKRLGKVITDALHVRAVLRKKLYGFAKHAGANVHEEAQQQFDRRSELLVHALLRDMSFKERQQAYKGFRTSIEQLARAIFDQVTAPYRHSIAGMEHYVKFKGSFAGELAHLK